ncbi:MAG: PAS domain S-box protein [Pseudomonadota bacterium]
MIAELQSAIANSPGRKIDLKRLTKVEAVKVKVDRAAMLFRGAPAAIAVNGAMALIAAAIAWTSVDRGILIAWTGAILSLSILRFAVWFFFKAKKPSGRNLANFAWLHIVATAFSGAMWGALAPIFAISGLLGNGFLPFVIAGVTASSLASAGASWRVVMAFNLPALAPLAAVYVLAGGASGAAIAGVVVLYFLTTAYLAGTTQRMIDRSILLRTKNERLFGALRKQVDDANLAEQRYRALVEASQDMTIIFSPEGRITYASPSIRKSLGGEVSDMIGLTTKDVVHPDDLPMFRAVGEKSLSNLGEVIELRHVCMRNGGGDYVELTGRLTNMLYVPGVEGFVFSGGLRPAGEASHDHRITAAARAR